MNFKKIITTSCFIFCTLSICFAEADKKIKVKEIITKNSEKECWMVINQVVYDLTKYIPLHEMHAPKEILTKYCGKDGTKAFANKGNNKDHSKDAYKLLEKYKIGILDIPAKKKQ